jgi:hypothetical protein
MQAPGYRWVCHKCASANEAGRSSCGACGFAASATAIEIAKAKGEPNPVAEGYRPLGIFAWLIAILVPWS